ncbi:hypothetical protein C5188_05665 [Serratia liquefaciens]|nr:hypothetical protein C5188_05665 [Serratia liquefaciens]
MPLCWLRSLTRITYQSKLIGISALTALMQRQLFWVYAISMTLILIRRYEDFLTRRYHSHSRRTCLRV